MEKLEKIKDLLWEQKKLIITILVFLIIIVSFFFSNQNNKNQDNYSIVDDIIPEIDNSNVEEQCYTVIDIKGEISKPGIYKVECESRVQDVIELAGGITEKADTSIINLGKKVFDEMVIIIYSYDETNDFIAKKQEEKEKEEACIQKNEIVNDACITEDKVLISEPLDTPVDNTINKISINNASKDDLMTLPGIGESKAQKIIDYRSSQGQFQMIEDLMNVSGIGDKVFAQIQEFITL